MSYSANVSAGDTILASHMNNLRKDIFNSDGHDHSGDGYVPWVPINGAGASGNYNLLSMNTERSVVGVAESLIKTFTFDWMGYIRIILEAKKNVTQNSGFYYFYYTGYEASHISETFFTDTSYTEHIIDLNVGIYGRKTLNLVLGAYTDVTSYVRNVKVYVGQHYSANVITD